MDFTTNWSFPTRIWFGPGRRKETPKALASAKIKRPLVVTDKGLKALPLIADLMALLEEEGFTPTLFADVKGNPIGQNITDGVAAYHESACDGVLAVGGGSGLDAAKVIALMVGQTRPVWDFEEKRDLWKHANAEAIAPVVAIPTTAGTGSEVGRAGVIVNENTHTKAIIFHPNLMPHTVISDPELTIGLPAAITAATGMDALTHCLEAYFSPGFHPMADGIALQGAMLVAEALPACFQDGADIDARAKMLAAASMGAVAFQKGLGGVHALAHSVGGLYDTHHGLTNAILLPYVLDINSDVIAEKTQPLARALNLKGESVSSLIDWVLELREQLEIPNTLSKINVPRDQADLVGRLAADDPCAAGNPKPLDARLYTQIFESAL